jgi:lactate dehydrogenase-like 2-hydroxyacid dehydrogenase
MGRCIRHGDGGGELDSAGRGAIPGTTDGGVADHAMGLMIDLAHGISRHDRAMRRGEWRPHRGVDMWHATLGIVGLGRIGRAVARRALDHRADDRFTLG